MSSSSLPLVLVTSAGGTNGTLALISLAATGRFRLRAGVRNPAKPFNVDSHTYKELLQHPMEEQKQLYSLTEFVHLDPSDAASVAEAFHGVQFLYLIVPLAENATDICKVYIDAAKAAGIQFIVKLSAIGASPNSGLHSGRSHALQEKMLEKSNIPSCILQSAFFADNFLKYDLTAIKSRGIFFGSASDGRSSFIDCRDLAACVAAILQNPKEYEGVTLALTGPKAYSETSAAAFISRVCGKEVRFVPFPEDVYLNNLIEWGVPKWQAEDLIGMDRMKKQKIAGEVTEAVQQVLGRPAISLEQHIQHYANCFGDTPVASFHDGEFQSL